MAWEKRVWNDKLVDANYGALLVYSSKKYSKVSYMFCENTTMIYAIFHPLTLLADPK